MESLTRFVRNTKGVNYGAIPDKDRGEGIKIGGDFGQVFTWKEKVKAPKTKKHKVRYRAKF